MVSLIHTIERKPVRLSNYKVKGSHDDMRLTNKGLLMRVAMTSELLTTPGAHFSLGTHDRARSESTQRNIKGLTKLCQCEVSLHLNEFCQY